jgi:UDP-GlcNAc:undecaprenyl-phosphate/decaprenyl-phosphate GlcNAc-1-phosphate transferase
MRNLQISFVAAIGLSALLTFVTIRLAHRFGWLVHPRRDRWSAHAVAQFGGVPMLLSFIVVSLSSSLPMRARVVCLCTAAMGAVGAWDDIFGLRPLAKLAAQVSVASVAVGLGISYPLTHAAAGNAVFTVLWIVGITNAMNLLDNMDGVAAGVGLIACAMLLLTHGVTAMAIPLIAMAGALSGFLFFNFSPAKIFMGDVGSLMMGFFVATSSVVMTEHLSSLFSVLAVPALVLFLPIFDTFLVSATRRSQGRAIGAGAKDHTSHRLVLLGMSERHCVLLLYGIAASSGFVAFLWKNIWPELGAGVLALFLVWAALFWLYLAKLDVPKAWLSRTDVAAIQLPKVVQPLARGMGRVLLDAALLTTSFYFALLFRYEHLDATRLPLFLLGSAVSVAVTVPVLAVTSAYSAWVVRSRRHLYPIVQSCIIGTLLTAVIIHEMWKGGEIVPAVVAMHAVFSACLLVLARASHFMFDDLLARTAPSKGLAIDITSRVSAASAPAQAAEALAIAAEVSSHQGLLFGVPISSVAELTSLIARRSVATVHLLPECPDTQRAAIASVCSHHGILVNAVAISMQQVNSAEMTGSARAGRIN